MTDINFILIIKNNTFREGVAFMLSTLLHYKVIGSYNNCKSLAEVNNVEKVDVFLVGEGLLNEKVKLRHLIEEKPFSKFVLLTDYIDNLYKKEVSELGFYAAVNKNEVYAQLPKALSQISNNLRYYPNR